MSVACTKEGVRQRQTEALLNLQQYISLTALASLASLLSSQKTILCMTFGDAGGLMRTSPDQSVHDRCRLTGHFDV